MLPLESEVIFVEKFVIMAQSFLIVYCVEWTKRDSHVLEHVKVILFRKGSLQM